MMDQSTGSDHGLDGSVHGGAGLGAGTGTGGGGGGVEGGALTAATRQGGAVSPAAADGRAKAGSVASPMTPVDFMPLTRRPSLFDDLDKEEPAPAKAERLLSGVPAADLFGDPDSPRGPDVGKTAQAEGAAAAAVAAAVTDGAAAVTVELEHATGGVTTLAGGDLQVRRDAGTGAIHVAGVEDERGEARLEVEAAAEEGPEEGPEEGAGGGGDLPSPRPSQGDLSSLRQSTVPSSKGGKTDGDVDAYPRLDELGAPASLELGEAAQSSTKVSGAMGERRPSVCGAPSSPRSPSFPPHAQSPPPPATHHSPPPASPHSHHSRLLASP